jgi:uncharacterized membrane protein YhaH (DUF805 family)
VRRLTSDGPSVKNRAMTRSLERWAALGGIGYVVLFTIGLAVSMNGEPGGDATPADVIAFYGQGSHRDRLAFGWLIMLVGFLFFIWFLAALTQAVRRLSADGLLATLTLVGGAVYVALGLAGSSLSMAIKTMSDDTYEHKVYPELIHAANDASYVIHSGGGVGAAAMMIAVAVAALRAAALPAWLCWLGVLAGVSAIFSIFFIPWIVIALWLVVASVLMFVSAGRTSSP